MAAREQLRELKLNVTNIKSVLVKGKEEEKRIKSKRVAFVRKDTQREKRIEKEKSVEKFRIPTLGVGNFVKNTASTAFGGIMGFLGNILTGYIVLKLPEIIAKAREVYDTIKPIWDGAFKTLSSIFSGVGFVYTKITSAFNRQEADKNLKEQEKLMNTLDKEVDSDIKFFNNILQSEGKEPIEVEGEELIAPSSLSDQSMGLGTPDPAPGPKMTPQPRNMGGEILKTTQPRIQDQRDDKHSHNPIRLFPKVANKTVSNTKLYKQNVEKFGQLVKSLKSSSLMRGKGSNGGGDPSAGYDGEVSKLMGSGGGALSGFTDEDWKYLGFVVSAEAQRDTDDEYGVAASVLNRVASKDWPNTIKGVIFQRNQYEAVYKGLSRHDPALVAKLRSPEGQSKIIAALNKLQGRTDFKGTTQYANYVPGEDIKFSSRGNFFHYSWQTGRNSVKPSNFADVDYQRFISKKNLGPVASKNKSGSVLLQTIIKEKVVQEPVAVASLNSSGGSNKSNSKLYNDILEMIG